MTRWRIDAGGAGAVGQGSSKTGGAGAAHCVVDIEKESAAWMRRRERKQFGLPPGEILGRTIAVIVGLFVLLILAAQYAGSGSSSTSDPNPQPTTQDTLPPVQPLDPNPPAVPRSSPWIRAEPWPRAGRRSRRWLATDTAHQVIACAVPRTGWRFEPGASRSRRVSRSRPRHR